MVYICRSSLLFLKIICMSSQSAIHLSRLLRENQRPLHTIWFSGCLSSQNKLCFRKIIRGEERVEKHLFSWGDKENNYTWNLLDSKESGCQERDSFVLWSLMSAVQGGEKCALSGLCSLTSHAVYLTRCPVGKAASGGIVAVMQYSL